MVSYKAINTKTEDVASHLRHVFGDSDGLET